MDEPAADLKCYAEKTSSHEHQESWVFFIRILPYLRRLTAHQLVKISFDVHKFVKSTLLGYRAFLQHYDPVAVSYSRKSVRYHQYSAFLFVNGIEHLAL